MSADDGVIPAIDKNASAVRLFEDEAKAALLLRAVGHEVTLLPEKLVEKIHHLRQVFHRGLLDDSFVHLGHAVLLAEGNAARKAGMTKACL